jgi:hypothetical protein
MSNPAAKINTLPDLETIGATASGSVPTPVSLGGLINATTSAAAFPARPITTAGAPTPQPPQPQVFTQLVAPAAGPAAITLTLPVIGNSAAGGANLYVPNDVIIFQRTDTALADPVNIQDGGAGTPNIGAMSQPTNRVFCEVQLNDAGTHWLWLRSGTM